MTLATLAEVLISARAENRAVAGLVTLGWEDMRAFAMAGQAEGLPVILQAGPSCRAHTPLPVLGKMFRHLAEEVDVPIVAHLDHGYTFDDCQEALDSGFTSLMFDGSRKPLQQNIDETAAVVELARSGGVSCEGEIGFVGYANGENSAGTDPAEAAEFAKATGVDAMAISVGNVHLQENKEGGLDEARIAAIEAVTDVPLVIHGGSGVPLEQRLRLARETAICKFNIGTELRLEFGSHLRRILDENPDVFDRVSLLKQLEEPLQARAQKVLRGFV